MATFFSLGEQAILELAFRGGTVLNPSKFLVLLSSATSFNFTDTYSTIAATEVTGTNCPRQPYAPGATIIDSTNLVTTLPQVICTFTNSGTAVITYNSAVLVANYDTNPILMFYQINDPDGTGSTARVLNPGASQQVLVNLNASG